MAGQRIRIRLKAFDHRVIDASAKDIVETVKRTGARVVLCATAGATDLLELRRQDRASLYDLAVQHPAPLVAAADVVAVEERRGVQGVERALTAPQVELVVRAVLALRPDVVVISLLHAYADDTHERRLAEALRVAAPGLTVVAATAVLPEIREYERTATADSGSPNAA